MQFAPGYWMQFAPGYWMHEVSGTLRPVVEKYLNGDALTETQIAIMRAYIRQWVMRGDWRGPEIQLLRDRVDELVDMKSLTAWLEDALDAGIDPL